MQRAANSGKEGEQGSTAISPNTLPAHIGKYDVEAEIGRGSVVKVFRARDRDIGRTVTLKVLTDARDRRLVELFRREIAIAAGLRHKNVVAIYELGEHAGLLFAATQHLDGCDLRQAIQHQSTLTLLEKLMILWQIAEGLRAAHHGGLTYVGVRPSGIILADDGCVTIQDFSIVRLLGGGEDEDVSYASAEEINGGFSPDPLCDVFALGAIYYEFLTGVHPYLTESGVDVEHKEAVPVRTLAPECPEELETLVHRALHKNRELRYQSVDDFQDDAELILSELKRARAAALVADVGETQSRKDRESNLDNLQSVIREALELDPGNGKGRQLQATLRAEQQRRALRASVQTLFREADEEAAARRFARAVEILDSALRLDPSSPEVQSRLEAMCARLEQYQSAAQLVSDARSLIVEEDLAEAQAKAAKAVAADPEYREAAELLATIGDTIERRAREARIEEGLARANALLQKESYDAAISVLQGLGGDSGQSLLVGSWLASAQAQKARHERRIRLRDEVGEIHSLIAGERFAEAHRRLVALTGEFPEDAILAGLRERAGEAMKRAAMLADAGTSCDELCRGGEFEKALAILDGALASYADDPALLTLRHAVEEQQRACRIATATRAALDETKWLLDQDRPDLAAAFLRGKSAELPEQPELAARLAVVEQMLPEWERRRLVQDTLGRVAALEQLQQWSVALALIEQVLASCPASEELLGTAERLRERQREEERRRKLVRRLETIRQRIASQAWPQALAQGEAAQTEFPGEPELDRLCEEARAGQRRSECEGIVAEVRQCLADGETDRAAEMLRKGLISLPSEAALEALREELDADRKYREEWRAAQALFGRRRFREAEEILQRLARPDRPDAQVLLETVRGARAASEEDNFFKRGREQALKLIEQQQFEQAADLLRNLLNLFPGDSILQRDLQLAEAGCPKSQPAADSTPRVTKPAAEIPPKAPPVMPRPEPAAEPAASKRVVWAAIAGSVLLLPVSAGFAWRFWPSQRAIASSVVPRPVTAAPRVAEETAAPAPPQPDVRPTPAAERPKSKEMPTPTAQPFRPPVAAQADVARAQTLPALPAPSADPLPVRQYTPVLPTHPVTVAAPPAPPPPSPTPAPSPSPVVQVQTTPTPKLGGTVVEPKVISHPAPAVPPLSALRGIYGDVTLEATVDPNGAVTEIKVISGHPILATAAKAAVAKWRYQPGTLNGRPVAMKVQVQVSFQDRK